MTPSFPGLFLSSAANRTTANKQEAPCAQLRARECGERAAHRPPPNNIIAIISHAHPLAAWKTKSVCKLRKSGAVGGRVPGTTSTARSGGCSGPAAPHPPAEPTFQRLGLLPSSSRGRGALISTCWILEVGSAQRAKGKALREMRSPREPVENCFSNLVVCRFVYAQICTLQPPERERERDKDRVREKGERENLSRRKGRAN